MFSPIMSICGPSIFHHMSINFCRSSGSSCVMKNPTFPPVLVPLLSLDPLQPLLSFHTAALSLSCQRFLMLSVRGRQEASQSRPENICNICKLVMPYVTCSRWIPLTCHIRVHVYSCGLHRNERREKKNSVDTCWRAAPPHLELLGELCVSTGDVALPFLGDRKGKERKKVTEWTSLTQLVAVKPRGQNENDTLLHNRKFCWCNTGVTLVNNCWSSVSP